MNLPSLAEDLIDLFLPRGCLGCGDRIPPDEGKDLVCVRCLILLRRPPPPRCPRCDVPFGTGRPKGATCLECVGWPEVLASARAAVVLESPADALVHAFKYDGWRALGGMMGKRMADLRPATLGDPLVIPVPTTPRRRRMRGYDQAGVLAEVVARELGFELVEGLERPRGGTQVRSAPRERRMNVHGVFRLSATAGSRIRGREVILVDDVLTTGATALSAVAALSENGVRSVHLLTFARALPFEFGERRDAEV